VPLADAVEDGAAAEVAAAGGVEDGAGLADPRAAGRRQGEQDDQRPGTQADSKTASSMLHIASIPPIEGALRLVSGWSQFNRGHIADSARTQIGRGGARARFLVYSGARLAKESDVILVTGATGRVGYHLMELLADAGAEATAMVRVEARGY